MLARLRKTQEENESGFTLIELLVVIIIIGILAAIAIPTFLNQRKKGWDAAAKSELRNAAVAQESYFTEDNGAGTSAEAKNIYADTESVLEVEGFNPSSKVDLTITTVDTPGSQSYCMWARHQSADATAVWYLGNEDGEPSKSSCT